MTSALSLLVLISLILLIIGFSSPKKSLFWYKQERTKKKSTTIYGIALVVFLILFGIVNKDKHGASSTADSGTIGSTEQKAEVPAVGIGQVLHANYFDVTVNTVSLEDRVNTGNQFANLKPEQGNMYLIINASFKNTDNESRMPTDGTVWINYNGKDYQFDKAETILLQGWGLLLDQINPLVTKTTNLVYKIPAEIKGQAYWQPGRASRDQRISLGNLQ